MAALTLMRAARVVALAGFGMPWLLVSCSGQPIITASGLGLATGQVAVRNIMTGAVEHRSGHPNLFVLMALLALAAGLIVSFQRPVRTAFKRSLLLDVAALAGAFLGLHNVLHKLAISIDRQGVRGLLSFETQPGYAVTMVATIVALGIGLLRMQAADSTTPPVTQLPEP